MKCEICNAPTMMQNAYALPVLVRAGDALKNLYACSRVCRDQWRDARQSNEPTHADPSADSHKENLPND